MNEELAQILSNGDLDACVAFFKGMSEAERRGYLAQIKVALKEANKTKFLSEGAVHRMNPAIAYAETALFAVSTISEIKKAPGSVPISQDAIFEILADRKPDWTDEFVEELLKGSTFGRYGNLVQRLINAGLAQPPTIQNYYLSILTAFGGRFRPQPIKEALLASPRLLNHDIWKLFEYEGNGEDSLANVDRFSRGECWSDVLLELADEGKLARQRLLDCSLEALERDFNHYRARWFHDFYDQLNPTESEIQRHSQRYLGLLRASAPNVATWALARVVTLAKANTYETPTLCHALEPILKAKAKGMVLEGLKLLGHLASQVQAAPLVCSTAIIGLAHEKSDVQNATLALLEKYVASDDPLLRDGVAKFAQSLAASVRKRCDKWLAHGSVISNAPEISLAKENRAQNTVDARVKPVRLDEGLEALFSIRELASHVKQNHLSIPAAKFDGTDIPRLNVVQRIKPIEDLQELIDVTARVIEDGSLTDDVERCIDGLSRLCGAKPPHFDQLCSPLLKRVRDLIKKGIAPFRGRGPSRDVLGMVVAFCSGCAIEYDSVPESGEGFQRLKFSFEGTEYRTSANNKLGVLSFLSARSHSIARRIARGQQTILLSTPTHENGWIDPLILADRMNGLVSGSPEILDVTLALLRLAPENRDLALDELSAQTDEWHQAVRYALGCNEVKIGRTRDLWVAAARARNPWRTDESLDKKFPKMGPDAAIAASYRFGVERKTSGAYTTSYPYFEVTPMPTAAGAEEFVTGSLQTYRTGDSPWEVDGGLTSLDSHRNAWVATIWPLARESYFASGARICFFNIDWFEADWGNISILRPLLDPGTPLRYAGLIFLVGMLAAKEPGESGLATDIAIRAIGDGRLGSDNLGAAMAELLQSGIIKPGRWQKTLAEVARASEVHAVVIILGLQHCLTGDVSSLPKDYSKLLDLLYELCVELELNVASEACREFLSKLSGGKSGKLAKNLLALKAPNQERVVRILEHAVEQRSLAAAVFIGR